MVLMADHEKALEDGPAVSQSLLSADKLSADKTERWLNRNVFGMSLASFFSDAGHEAATAILPLFLTAIGAPAAALGAIEGVADATSSFVKLLSGWISDRLPRRKPIAISGYILTGITTGLFALANAWPFLLVVRALGWLGRGIRGPVRDAMLVESVPEEARGRAFGFHRAGDTLGAITGPLFAAALISLLKSQEATILTYRQIFWITMVPGLLSAASFALFVREKARHTHNDQGFFLSLKNLPARYKRYLLAVGIFGAGDFAHSLLTLRAVQVLTPVYGSSRAGEIALLLYALHNVFYAGMSYPIGALADRIGKRGLLALGYGTAALMAVGWIFGTPSIAVLAVLFALGGSFIAAEDTLEGALAADLMAQEARGMGYGILATINGIGDFASSLIVGVLWSALNPIAGFTYSAVLFVVGALMVLRLK